MRRVLPQETYWSIAQALLRENAPALATEDAYAHRIQRRLIQLNQHRNLSADINLLQLRDVTVPEMTTYLRAPHGKPNGQVHGGLHVQQLSVGPDGVVSYSGDIFTADVVLDTVDIAHDVCFCGVTFRGNVTISKLRIEGYACFENADFHGQVIIREVVVRGDLAFDGATFRRDVILERVQVLESLSLSGSTIERDASIEVTSEGATYFGFLSGAPGGFYLRRCASLLGTYCVEAKFDGDLHVLDHHSFADLAITQVNVAGDLEIEGCRVDGDFSGRRLDVSGDCRIDPLAADSADFWKFRARGSAFMIVKATTEVSMLFLRVDGTANLQVDAGSLDGSGMWLAEGGSIILSGGGALFEAASFPANTIIRGTGEGVRPQLRSLIDSRVTGLALSRLDVGDCIFEGVHDLDELRIEDDVTWQEAPRSGLHRWATRRQVLREEALLRAGGGAVHWSDGEPAEGATSEENRRASLRVAEQYRALRKGFEDRKNEPGAADFYYGEMEMRRLGATSRAERSLLTVYWLLSGYSLRAWRAVGALLALIAVSTVVVAWGGFATVQAPVPQVISTGPEGKVEPLYIDPDRGTVSAVPPKVAADRFRDRLLPALTYSAESATVVFRGPETRTPTLLGRWFQILLRLLGPALLALAVLSVRGRVKR